MEEAKAISSPQSSLSAEVKEVATESMQSTAFILTATTSSPLVPSSMPSVPKKEDRINVDKNSSISHGSDERKDFFSATSSSIHTKLLPFSLTTSVPVLDKKKNTRSLKKMVQEDLFLLQRSKLDDTLLHNVRDGKVSLVKECIDKNVEVNSVTEEGTVLHVAISTKNFEMVKTLIEYGMVDINLVDHRFNSCIEITVNFLHGQCSETDSLLYTSILQLLLLKRRTIKIEDFEMFLNFCLSRCKPAHTFNVEHEELINWVVSRWVHEDVGHAMRHRKERYLTQAKSLEAEKFASFSFEEYLALHVRMIFELALTNINQSLSLTDTFSLGCLTSKDDFISAKLCELIMCEIEMLRMQRDFASFCFLFHAREDFATTYSETIALRIQNLANGKELIFPAGWVSHAVYISFKRENDAIAIIIYNLGSGRNTEKNGTLCHKKDGTKKNHIFPCILGKVSRETLLPKGKNLTYVRNLILAKWSEREKGVNFVYDLEETLVSLEKCEAKLKSSRIQKRDNCVVANYQAWLKNFIDTETASFIFKKDIALIEKISSYERSTDFLLMWKRNEAIFSNSKLLCQASHKQDLEMVKHLFNYTIDIEFHARYLRTPLHWAASIGNVDLMKVLLEHKAFLESRQWDGGTPLHCATWYGQLAAVAYLLQAGANIKAKSKRASWTPLHTAAHHGHEDIVKLLVKYQAPLNVLDDKGNTPSQLAAANGHVRVKDFLDQANFLLTSSQDILWQQSASTKKEIKTSDEQIDSQSSRRCIIS